MKAEEIDGILQRHRRHLDEKLGGQRANFSESGGHTASLRLIPTR
jgi:hypothetical protein